MPPKAQTGSKKAEAKAKQKIVEDKTFGLKNKNKSAKVTKYIQTVEQQVKNSGNRKLAAEVDTKTAIKDKKKAEEDKKAELAALFKPVMQQKVPPGVDPKTVLCTYFKSGQCQKGDKCKFSHDLAVERRATKINLYEDRRVGDEAEATESRPEDTMQDWDQHKLELVVERKHRKGPTTTTEIVCKFFLDAIEKKSYGWFWECPNGGDACKYRHALPPGFVLKGSTAARKEATEEQISLEEFLEIERYRIEKRTPVTKEAFLQWKANRKARQDAEERSREKDKEAQIKAGKMLHASGRDLFMYNPDAFMDADDDEAMDVDYTRREVDDENEGQEQQPYGEEGMDESAFLDEDLENLEIDDGDDDDDDENKDDDSDNNNSDEDEVKGKDEDNSSG